MSFSKGAGSPASIRNRPDSSNVSSNVNTKEKPNPLSYPQSAKPFSTDLFKNPTSEYRGCPFWSWNAKLDKQQLLKQIDYFQEMGMGGFHMHVRTGLDTDYLGPEFMDLVRACVDKAENQGMLACLYDDDRWPSGAVGGKLTKEYPEHKGKHLLFTTQPYGTVDLGGGCSPSSARACRSEDGYLIARYAIKLHENGSLKSSRKLHSHEVAKTGEVIWYAYVETNPPSQWFNGQTYVDTLSKKAMSRFIKMTHEVYKDKVGDKFGTVIPCIFTDEPQFATKTVLSSPTAKEDIFLPWTTDLEESFKKAYLPHTVDLVQNLPEVIWNLPGGKWSLTRYLYHDHVCETFVSAFMDQLGAWCRQNKLMLNGHMMEEPTLWSQTTALGEAMRCYRSQEMPGIDLLVDGIEFNTAKQASSVARQNGVRGTMSEIYGCTHWYFTFEGHKGCGDWQAALGITFRVHHLSWLSMAGEAKRDFPASINYQSPWYKEYRYIEDHFARVGVAMTRGHAVTRVAVLHPIESFWQCFGPNGSSDEMQWRDRAFLELTHWLLHGLIDFDFISESLLPDQYGGVSDGKLVVGKCRYDAVIMPNNLSLRETTFKILMSFESRGGRLITAGQVGDTLIGPHGISSNSSITETLRAHTTALPWNQEDILASVEEYRELSITTDDGNPASGLLYQMRQDGDERFVFICNTDREHALQTTVSLKGLWDVEVLDTLTGERKRFATAKTRGWTVFPQRFEGCASLLLRLSPLMSPEPILTIGELARKGPKPAWESLPVELESISLSESNVLLLDLAQYKVDDGRWSRPTEVLRIDNEIRDMFRLPRKDSAWRQPWTVPKSERAPKAHVALEFAFESDMDLDEPTQLALEDADKIKILINGKHLASNLTDRSWWVDESINTVPIAPNTIHKGTNSIRLDFPFGVLTNLERIYLLGKFKVQVDGQKTTLQTWRSSDLTWGNTVEQGLPFYVGNVTYNCRMLVKARSHATLSVPQFSSPVLTVTGFKGMEKGHIALQPRTLDLGTLDAGVHKFDITAFGNRYNSFGHVHLPHNVWGCSWRTDGAAWTDDYALKPIGILECPNILVHEAGHGGSLENTARLSSEWILVHPPSPK